MKYSEEDRKYIESWLNKCITIEKGDNIYYVTSDNITRQLKYNRLLKHKKEINIDLTQMNFNNNVIIEQDLKNNYFWVNYYIIWLKINSKYRYNYNETCYLINSILCDILKLKQYTTDINNI